MAGTARGQRGEQSLRDEVRDALLEVLRDGKAPPTARAIAGRSLVQLMGDGFEPGEQRPASSMTIDELDAEIASIQQPGR
jgi:hypothetical protein